MKCAWQAYLNLIPIWLRKDVDKYGRDTLQELRLRLGRPPELRMNNQDVLLDKEITQDDLSFSVNAASRYSPWAATTSACGYITAAGGHRVGICGEVTAADGKIQTLSSVTSLSLRVARDFPGIGLPAAHIIGSTLIVGSPGRGKTTLLRDIIRQKANLKSAVIAVVDERKEIFPVSDGRFCFPTGLRTEVLSGYSKRIGIETALRTMTPTLIAVDEITAEVDCDAMIHCGWCGVDILATAHANNREDLKRRNVYRPLIECGLFQNLIIIQPDKSWVLERMEG